MTTGWKLASGTGYCEVEGELVFLDLVRDKYFALRGEDRAAFDRLRVGEPNDSDAMGRLVATGLLARSSVPTKLDPASLPIPTEDLSGIADGPTSLRMGFAASRALRWAGRAMRPKRIAATVEAMRDAKLRLGVPGAEAAVRDVASSYAASRWMARTPTRCLIDALALDHILLSRGLCARLVFGVRLSPFAAHCWLQSPGAVLTGTSAEARNFTPILAIG